MNLVLKLGVWILKIPFLSIEEVGRDQSFLVLGSNPVLGISPNLKKCVPGIFLGTSNYFT